LFHTSNVRNPYKKFITVTVVVKALRYWSDGPAIDSRWCHWGFFSVVPPTEPCALRSTQTLKVSNRDFSWVKGGRCVWLKTYHPCSAETSRKSGALIYPEPLGPTRPVAGHLYFTFYCNTNVSANEVDCAVTVLSWLAHPVRQRFDYRRRQGFLGDFAKLRKATISFVMSVRLSVRPHGTPPFPLNGFPLNLILSKFRKSIKKIQVSSKYDKKNGYFACRPTYIMIISHSVLLRMRNISGKSFREIQDKHCRFCTCF